MKKSIKLFLAIAIGGSQTFGFKQADLDKLKKTKECFKCDLSGVDLSNAKLVDSDMGGLDLSDSNLRKADLNGVSFYASDLEGVDFTGANLVRAKFQFADLTGAVLRDAKLDFANMDRAKLCNTVMPDGQRIFDGCSIQWEKIW